MRTALRFGDTEHCIASQKGREASFSSETRGTKEIPGKVAKLSSRAEFPRRFHALVCEHQRRS